ncbi:TetR/AcrR family transcriptional regulator [Lactobacillus sp. DCY120]|uniref:TetR/AcrR family transcriptional regulator n=1 Tax=Bombilactobacillus apium TaxID=2675299 RepID=A0A850R6V4_9LACO|nr:TetR/AcrR family transcriptional regulator [Bombilactobacillus apium]NVY96557.1 TetR/AcrR family transcriptional regulator [Bombilactobacillus apium]
MSNQRINREQVLETGRTIIYREGMGALTFPRLAKELNIRSQSLYNYFKNLDDLIGQIGAGFMNELYQLVVESLVGLSGKAAFQKYALVAHDYLENQGRMVELLYHVHNFDQESDFYQAMSKVLDLLHKLVASVKLRHLDAESYVQTLLSSVLGFTFIEVMGFLPKDQQQRDHEFAGLLQLQLSEIKED